MANKALTIFVATLFLGGCALSESEKRNMKYYPRRIEYNYAAHEEGYKACRKAEQEIGIDYDCMRKGNCPNTFSVKVNVCSSGTDYYASTSCYWLGKFFEKKGFLRCAVRWYNSGCRSGDKCSCKKLSKLQREIITNYEKYGISDMSQLYYSYEGDKYETGVSNEERLGSAASPLHLFDTSVSHKRWLQMQRSKQRICEDEE